MAGQVWIRPHLGEFFQRLAELPVEVVVFTASLPEYARPAVQRNRSSLAFRAARPKQMPVLPGAVLGQMWAVQSCMHGCIHACLLTCKHACILTCVHVCVRARVHAYVAMHPCAWAVKRYADAILHLIDPKGLVRRHAQLQSIAAAAPAWRPHTRARL